MDIFSYNSSASLTEKGRIFYLFFLRFLKEHKCFYAYKRALLSHSFVSAKMAFFISLCNAVNTSIISNSFIWCNTIEGDDFWRLLDRKFKLIAFHAGF